METCAISQSYNAYQSRIDLLDTQETFKDGLVSEKKAELKKYSNKWHDAVYSDIDTPDDLIANFIAVLIASDISNEFRALLIKIVQVGFDYEVEGFECIVFEFLCKVRKEMEHVNSKSAHYEWDELLEYYAEKLLEA